MVPGPDDLRAQLHTRNPTGRFSDRAEDYKKFRPSYPVTAIDWILEGLGDPAALIAADVGAGTGISSTLLADRGVHVIAIEPNAQMRGAAEPSERVAWVEGTAERTGLKDSSVGLVVCAQAFHWFEGPLALAEFHRILQPSGRVALMWNDRDRSDPYTRAYSELIAEASGRDPVADDHTRPGPLMESPLFAGVVERSFGYDQRMSEAGIVGRALSASYIPKSGPACDALVEALRRMHAAHADATGHAMMRYKTRVFIAHRAE